MKVRKLYLTARSKEEEGYSYIYVCGLNMNNGSDYTCGLDVNKLNAKLGLSFFNMDQKSLENIRGFYYEIVLDQNDVKGLGRPVLLKGEVLNRDLTTQFIYDYLKKLSELSVEEVIMKKACDDGTVSGRFRMSKNRMILEKPEITYFYEELEEIKRKEEGE